MSSSFLERFFTILKGATDIKMVSVLSFSMTILERTVDWLSVMVLFMVTVPERTALVRRFAILSWCSVIAGSLEGFWLLSVGAGRVTVRPGTFNCIHWYNVEASPVNETPVLKRRLRPVNIRTSHSQSSHSQVPGQLCPGHGGHGEHQSPK